MPNSVALIIQSMLQKNVNEQVLQNNGIRRSCSRRTQCTDISKWRNVSSMLLICAKGWKRRQFCHCPLTSPRWSGSGEPQKAGLHKITDGKKRKQPEQMQRPYPEQLIKACLLYSRVQTAGSPTSGLSEDYSAVLTKLWELSRICTVVFAECHCCRISFHTLMVLKGLL